MSRSQDWQQAYALKSLGSKVENLPVSFVAEPGPGKIQPVPGFKYWKDASRAAFRDRASFDVEFGEETMRVNFELPGSFTIWHGSAPDLLPRRRDVFHLEIQGLETTLKTTLLPAAPNG